MAAPTTDQGWYDLWADVYANLANRGAKSYAMPTIGRSFTALDIKEVRDQMDYWRARLSAAKRIGCGVVRFGPQNPSPTVLGTGPIVSHFP